MNKIQVKAIFSGWVEVTREEAIEFARQLYSSITTMEGQKLIDYINTEKLKGVKVTRKDLI